MLLGCRGRAGRVYAPAFLDGVSVTLGKHLEAVREGMQDFAYLSMLRDRVAALAGENPGYPLLARARQLLEDGVSRVIRVPGASQTDWREARDRSAADAVRIEIAELLEKLR